MIGRSGMRGLSLVGGHKTEEKPGRRGPATRRQTLSSSPARLRTMPPGTSRWPSTDTASSVPAATRHASGSGRASSASGAATGPRPPPGHHRPGQLHQHQAGPSPGVAEALNDNQVAARMPSPPTPSPTTFAGHFANGSSRRASNEPGSSLRKHGRLMILTADLSNPSQGTPHKRVPVRNEPP
jgi:hypothetical protein